MKHLRSLLSVILVSVLFSAALIGCSPSKKSPAFPFTKLTWDNTYDDMVALEGKSTNTSDSIYKGTTYLYPKSYLNLDGTVKYMYDADNKLMCVAWSYAAKSSEDLKSTYNKIRDQLKKTYGDSGYNTDNPGNYGDVWYRDEGNIILSAVTTNSIKSLQYSYLNPAVSSKNDK